MIDWRVCVDEHWTVMQPSTEAAHAATSESRWGLVSFVRQVVPTAYGFVVVLLTRMIVLPPWHAEAARAMQNHWFGGALRVVPCPFSCKLFLFLAPQWPVGLAKLCKAESI